MIRVWFSLAVALSCEVALHAQTGEPIAADWPRFLGRGYDGVVTSAGLSIRTNSEPTLTWALDVGEGYGLGSVAGNRYFHFDAVGPGRDQLSERLRCIAVEDGQVLWTQSQPLIYRDMFGYEDGPRSSPTVAGDRMVTLGVAGRMSCRRLRDGELIWSLDTNAKYGVVQNFFGVGSSPLILDDRVIVMVGGSPAEDQNVGPALDRVSSNGSALVAFDLASGNELWRSGNDLASYSSPRPIVIGGQTFVLLLARGGLMLVDPRSGELKWRFDHRASKLESVNAMVPVVVDDLVFVSECYEVGSALLKVSRDDYRVLWKDTPARRDLELKRQAFRAHWTTPIVIDGFLYGGSGRNAPDSDFRCIELKTGDLQWSALKGTRSTATRLDDKLLVLDERGTLLVVRPNPEQLDVVARWSLNQASGDRPAIRFPCWAAPIVVGSKLLLRGDRRVLCLDLVGH